MKKLIGSLIVSLFLFTGLVHAEDASVCVKVESEVTESKSMEVSNPDLKLSILTAITSEGAYTKLYSSLNVSDTTNMWNDIIWLKDNTDIRDIYVYINSPGGSAFDGIALSNWISFAEERWGFRFHGYASGVIASAAVPVFVSMTTRTAMPGTIFMVHEAAIFKWGGRETSSDIRSQNELMEILRDQYLKILVDNTNLTKEEWEFKEDRTTWFTAEEAKLWGLLTEGDE